MPPGHKIEFRVERKDKKNWAFVGIRLVEKEARALAAKQAEATGQEYRILEVETITRQVQ